MVVHEFRIPLPLTVEEFHRGQLFMTAQASLEASEGSEGIEWIKNEPYDNTDGHWGTSSITGTVVPKNKGQYTLKRYHFKSKVPNLLASLAPTNALFLIEEAWNAYPHCKTVLVNGYLSKDRLRIDVETMHVEQDINIDNVLKLTPAEIKQRTVEYIDIRSASDPSATDYKSTADSSKFTSTKTGRGPLLPGWEKNTKPLMCAYKVVRANCGIFGLQTTVENAILNQQRNIFTQTLNKAFVTIDNWHGMTMDDIRKMEDEVAKRANEQLKDTVQKAVPLSTQNSNTSSSSSSSSSSSHTHDHGHGHSHGHHGHSH